MPPNYQNGKIYTVRSRSRPELIYVGSTTRRLSERFYKHTHYCNRCSSKQIIDIGDAYIELYELFPSNSKIELERREGEIIRSMECVNNNIAGRTYEEYCRDNAEKIATRMKQWTKDNAESIAIRRKQFYIDNKDSLKLKSKIYRTDNRESISTYQKIYHANNRESNKNSMKQYHIKTKDVKACICGRIINHGHKRDLNRHYKSGPHLAYIEAVYAKIAILKGQ